MERMHEPAGSGTGGIISSSSAAASGAAASNARPTCAARFATLLHERGLLDALGYLNERTRYRFTGLYRADPPLLRNVGLFDRENPDIDVSGAVTKLDETYCSITCATAKPFTTMDAPHDERLVTHAARDSVLCYAGVPIRLEGGRPWGTLCHFDLRPRLLSADELRALETVAPIVAGWLRIVIPHSR
jgi:GAF domain-containing protein